MDNPIYQLPPFQPQSCPPQGFDADSCPNEATIGAIEMKQGIFQQWSVSGAAVLSGTKPGIGNDLQTVINAYNKSGLISYSARPLDPIFNQASYYAPITSEQLATANKSMQFTLVAPDLNISPVILRLKLPTTYHFVITRDMVNYIDSYQPQVKSIDWSIVVGQWSIKINLKYMLFGYQAPGNSTVYVQVGQCLVPLTDWQTFLNLGGNQQSVVSITQEQLDASTVIASDYFKSK